MGYLCAPALRYRSSGPSRPQPVVQSENRKRHVTVGRSWVYDGHGPGRPPKGPRTRPRRDRILPPKARSVRRPARDHGYLWVASDSSSIWYEIRKLA